MLSQVFAADDPQLIWRFAQPTDESPQPRLQLLKDSQQLKDISDLINDMLILQQPIVIEVVTDSEETGAYYDPQNHHIVLPTIFIDEIFDSISQSVGFDNEPEQASIDLLSHIVLHEVGHALVEQYDLAVVGKEEDAVDGFATVMLAENFVGGGAISLASADYFASIDESIGTLEQADFWDEHSLDIQRYYALICQVYGSSPSLYPNLLKDAGLPAERAEFCIEEYANLAYSWQLLLQPHLSEALPTD